MRYFFFGSLRVNSVGVNLVLFIGAAKMMIPVYLKHLIIAIPLTINGIISGLLTYFIGIKGTPLSAGFGYTGLVGPINAFNRMPGDSTFNILLLALGYFIVPFISAFIIHELCKSLYHHIMIIFIDLKSLTNNIILRYLSIYSNVDAFLFEFLLHINTLLCIIIKSYRRLLYEIYFKTMIIAILIGLTFINIEPMAHADQDAKWEKLRKVEN